jgi:hypothetical protein|tara:strand:+ start:2531 stop:2725 length:195 start_codon:yes stop_codon:yes gene_type:complete
VKRRGQSVTLTNKKTGEERKVVVVLADSKMGYLAADPNNVSPLVLRLMDDREWGWYHPDEWAEL